MQKIIAKNKLSILATTLPLLLVVYYYNRLPEKIAIHFDFNFNADNFIAKKYFIFLPLAILLFQVVMLWLEDKKGHANDSQLPLIPWIIPAISLFGVTASINYSVYEQTSIIRLAPILLGIMFLAIGNFLPKTTQNKTVGIKLPWTLKSEDNWYHTHRFTGFLWVIIGILIILLTLTPFNLSWLIFLIALAAILPVIYSYLLAKKQINN